MVLLGHFWTWGKKTKKNPATTFHLTRQPRAFNLSPMQARENAGCAKSRPGTHPGQIRETKDRPDSNGSVGSLLDLGQKKKKKSSHLQPPSIPMNMDKKRARWKGTKNTHDQKKIKNHQTQKRPTRPIEICLVFGFLSLTWVGLRPGSAHFAIPRFSGGICRVFKLIPS